MACVYILYSNTTRKFYIGSSRENNADKRIKAHNSGRTKSTKSGRPWILISIEQHTTYTDARKRELFLKSGVGRAWIKEKFGYYKA
ncbi:MAG: GIY-YIG nuclease family protein [Planctomycetes bacterium]|nr:GIY-YIG nuclease family protein [Planctomycetota bacterium]